MKARIGETVEMYSKVTQAPAISFAGEKYVTESNFDVPDGWTLFDREQVDATIADGRKETLFYERWVETASGKALVVSKMIGNGQDASPLGNVHPMGAVYFTVEEFIDPVDVESFIPKTARVNRAEFLTDEEAYASATRVMEGMGLGGQPANSVSTEAEQPVTVSLGF